MNCYKYNIFEKLLELGTYLAEQRAKDPLVAKPYFFFATFLPLKQIYEKITLSEKFNIVLLIGFPRHFPAP